VNGVFAAVATPMRDDLAVDRHAFAQHSRRLLDAGCHGLGIFGTTGEANSLAVGERVEAIEALVADGIPADVLLPGTGACALPDAVRLTQAALALGAPGVLALPPFYYKGVSDDGLFRFFAELIERVGDDRLRLFLYHIPPQTVLGFSPELIGRLLDAYPATIAGTKDSAGDAARIERICTDFPQLTVFAGPRSSCSTPCAGAATAASRRRSTSRRARPARSTTASSPARTPGPPRPR
jgi:4-hydroxy-tetrahydrodipicolinate synthase